MSAAPQFPGFYGKFPHLGDFVMRRLPRDFVDAWDHWLQAGISASRERLGEAWLDRYLVSPIWRFALSPGLCGSNAWAGILMPSVDRVGRYFPLTIAAAVDARSLSALFLPHSAWFESLEQLALSGLDDSFDLEAFNEALAQQPVPALAGFLRELQADDGGLGMRRAFQWGLHDLAQMPVVFADFNRHLLTQIMPTYSYWSTVGSDLLGPSFLVCEGLPPVDAYTALLTGEWSQRGWSVRGYALAELEGDQTLPAPPRASRAVTEPLAPVARWASAGISVVGCRRKINEDALLDHPQAGLWVVADGMGGHQAGDVASKAVVAALADLVPIPDLAGYQEAVGATLERVNATLWQMGSASARGEVIGSTVVGLLARGSQCSYFWAGDSRLYRYRGGSLEQLTHDHSLFDDLVRQGIGDVAQLLEQGRCNVITRAVGADAELDLEFGQCQALAGDLYLLCSDGLDKELGAAEIGAVCGGPADPEAIAGELIRLAEARGARDNVTVLVVRYAIA